jgi:glyoxylate utilization-related uncharacterized protein
MDPAFAEKINSLSENSDFFIVEGEIDLTFESSSMIIRNNKYSYLAVRPDDVDLESTFVASS